MHATLRWDLVEETAPVKKREHRHNGLHNKRQAHKSLDLSHSQIDTEPKVMMDT